ncbi:hypothetical protein NPS01_08500 [Nocardioides psychrotolerans]|uniref:Tryptophan-associated transmembrane protein (Trp_oprn_chp) n=1 Tax=Nocardioides psychrotolerans TaxID=1005945 RepID=A0A1I3FKS2_9ACTN|nr:Trp biosynthesis-associated membrane protein [Nocardioides psychrotolerans]GEP37187.1 hypothetical protein NPS01_08500 [Nocardioides psychrotolerans]SFI11809.1 Tryptophan-associated transmembrane protein (Trp_oprn_chp) [Nocardioides psychrotolerans]
MARPDGSARSAFVPTVLAGLATAGLTAIATNQTLATARPTESGIVYSDLQEGSQVPLALTLSLVVLACWGVVLVTRRVVRRGVAVLGLAAAVGAAASVVLGRGMIIDSYRADFRDIGATPVVDLSWWYWLALVLSVLAVLPAAVAARQVGRWPEMGTRYDAPGDQEAVRATPDEDEEPSSLELWKAIDEGRDPTR